MPERFAIVVEFDYRIERRSETTVRPAAIIGPDVAIGSDVDAGGRTPGARIGKLAPVGDGGVGVGEVVRRSVTALGKDDRGEKKEKAEA